MKSDPRPDEVLMALVASGDRGAYETLYARWSAPLFRFLVRRTGARAAAEDAHQEAWLRVHRFSSRYDPGRPFRSWIFTIAANCGRDAAPDQRERELYTLPPQPGEPPDLLDRVTDGLARLSPDDRRLLLLAVEGFDGAEIGQMMGIGAGAVRMRLHRARQRVREALEVDDA